MSVEKKEFRVKSSDNNHELVGMMYYPKGKIKGFFHVVHGMTEHIERYNKFLGDMADLGWLSFAYDNLGHGKTATDDSELGYIAKNNGWDILAKDVKVFSDAVIAEYYSKDRTVQDLPYILMGHSMGSFIARVAAEKYVKPAKLILMGTSGENKAAGAGLALASVIKAFKGERYVSPLLDKIAFGSYNDRFGGGTAEDPKPWLTTELKNRNKYYADKFCMFNFSVSAMIDLIRLIKECNRADWFKNISKDMPIYIISGEDDPVGNYGKGVLGVYERLKAQNCNVTYKLYKGARHELLQEYVLELVICDILSFINDGDKNVV